MKMTSRARAELQESVSDPRRAGTIDSKAMQRVVEADAPVTQESTLDNVTKHIERQTLRAFLDAVTIWGLDESDSKWCGTATNTWLSAREKGRGYI